LGQYSITAGILTVEVKKKSPNDFKDFPKDLRRGTMPPSNVLWSEA
jgi:hypothetical protein